MKKLLKIERFLSLLGVSKSMCLPEKKRVIITNRLSILTVIIIIAAIILISNNMNMRGFIRLLSPLPLFLIPLILNYYKKTKASKYVFMFSLFYVIIFAGARLSNGTIRYIASGQLILLAVTVTPFLLFDVKQKFSILFFISIIVISYFLTPYLHVNLHLENSGVNAKGKEFYMDAIAPVIAFAILISSFFSSQILELQIVMKLLEKTKNFNKKLEKQVTERTQQLNQSNKKLQTTIEIVNEQKQQIEDKNKHITDSINYAAHIQKAILGDINEITKNFSEAFIFFKPHSIVSGDFYWYADIPDKGIKIIAAADCTGHGVPGAFMTIMGHDFLEEIVKSKGIHMPDKIIEELDKKITARLKKESSKKQVNDGMDIAILNIDVQDKKVYFSGAKNPLYHIQNDKLNIIKGSLSPIGGIQFNKNTKKEFELHEIIYQENDMFYIFSDGFQDQFGYENNRKYLTKHFRNFLHKISNLSIHQQAQKLETELHQWQGSNRQTDDILIIGVKM